MRADAAKGFSDPSHSDATNHIAPNLAGNAFDGE
jgi:hypothetical protein